MADNPIEIEEGTPSPVSKNDGSNKRIIITQRNPMINRKQPPAPEITLEAAGGQDGTELPNSNPNHNPNSNDVIPTTGSRQLHEYLHKYRAIETKLTKLDHHIDFLQTCQNEGRVPYGLRWNVTINLMEATEDINQELRQFQIESELNMVSKITDYYKKVQKDLNNERTTLENTLENLKNDENNSTIQKAIEDQATEKQVLSKKLKQKRVGKLRNLTSGALRMSESYASVTSRRIDNSLNFNQQSQRDPRPRPRPRPPPIQNQSDDRAHRTTSPPPSMNRDRHYRETPPPLPPPPRHREEYPPPHHRPAPPPSQPVQTRRPPPRPVENNFGEVVNTFTMFLHNLNQQTGQLLSSLSQLNLPTTRN